MYDEAFQWPYEKRVNTFRMPRGGAKITDPQLENCLLEVVAECEEGNLQVLAALVDLGAHSHSMCTC